MPSSNVNAPDPWAIEASTLPLAFAQVREDPRLDREIAETLPPDGVVVMIASGGETVVPLARQPLARIHAVDMNPAQIAIARLKLHLARTTPPDAICRILGHEPMPPSERRKTLESLLATLLLPETILGPLDLVSELGPDHAGRYERCFAAMRQLIKDGSSRREALAKVRADRFASTLPIGATGPSPARMRPSTPSCAKCTRALSLPVTATIGCSKPIPSGPRSFGITEP
jgi:hypothetical protein